MKKVLFLITKSNFGGAQRYVYDLASHLPKADFQVTVAAGGNGWLLDSCTQGGIRTVTLPSLGRDISLFKDWRSFSEVRALLRREKPDILHLNSSKAAFLGALAGRLEGVPKIIFTAHGWSFNEKRPWYQQAVFRLVQGMTILLAHATIAVSEKIKRDAPLQKGVHRIYHGIAETGREEAPKARATLKALCPHFDTGSLTIGTIGELHSNKGHDILIEALALLPREMPWQAVIIGEGEERGRLEARIGKHRLEERVFLAGHINNAARLLNAFDIFAFPSRTEALGYALLEAGLAALPVVAPQVGGIPEVIRSEETGTLVQKENPRALASALQAFMADAELRARYGNANRERIAEVFSFERMLAETGKVYGR